MNRLECEKDNAGRPSTVTYPDGRKISYGYDGLGNIVQTRDSILGTTTYRYDALGRFTGVISARGRQLTYLYNTMGNLVKAAYPDGRSVTYKYGSGHRLEEVVSDYARTIYHYDNYGRVVREILSSGVTTSFTYGEAGRPSRQTATDGTGRTFLDLSLAFDRYGNCREIKDLVTRRTQQYSYDVLHRLTAIRCSVSGEIKYKYDFIGNRVHMEVVPKDTGFRKVLFFLGLNRKKTSYSYNSQCQLLKAGERTFEYDGKGNLTGKDTNGKVTRYTWEVDGKLKRVDFSNGVHVELLHDGLGNRVGKRTSSGKAFYRFVDKDKVILELDGKGEVLATYIHHPLSVRPVWAIIMNNCYCLHYDQFGSLRALTDGSGSMSIYYEFDAWGNIPLQQSDRLTPFIFLGMEWDQETELYISKTDYYDPCVGRYINKNQSAGFLTNPQTLNTYSFACNNPLVHCCSQGRTVTASRISAVL